MLISQQNAVDGEGRVRTSTITITVEGPEEVDALIAGLDHDRNHPVREHLYGELRALRAAANTRATVRRAEGVEYTP